MKHRFYSSLLAFFVAAVIAVPSASAQQTVDNIVAVVNSDVILASELAAAVQQTRARMGAQADNIPADTLRSNTLDQLIFARLQLERAKQQGLSASDNDIQQGIARLAQQNGMQVNEFMQALQQQGVPLDAVKQRIKTSVLIQKLRRKEVMEKVSVSDQDVTRFLQSQSLRDQNNREYHILDIRIDIPAGAGSTSIKQIRQRIEDIRDQVLSGEASFAALAKANSDGDEASRGGDLGWLGSAFMPESFIDIVPKLGDGQVSQVFRGEGGFHIIKLVGSRGSRNLAGGETVMVDEVEVRHIILKPNKLRNDDRTRELAVQIRERLDAGGDFGSLAKEYSDDKSTRDQGGDLGWIQAEALGPREATRVAQMQPGEVSPILKTKQGYIIVKVTDRRQRDKTREAIRSRARQVIGQRKAEAKGRRWLQKLRSEAYIDIRMPGYQSISD